MRARKKISAVICLTGLLVALIIISAGVSAEPAYVTDQLQLGVHLQPDTSDQAFTKLKSGERVEIQETNRYHALVIIPDGRKGWVKKIYLVPDKPAVLRVTEVERERDKAVADLESLTAGLNDRESQVGEMEARIAAREAAASADEEELTRLRAENADLTDRLEAYAFSVPGTVFFVAAAVCLVAGGLLSWWWFDRRSRARHGGFRIY